MKVLVDTNVALDILLKRKDLALDLDWNDFEDSVQYIVGENLSVDYIVTRNTGDYASGSIPAVEPKNFLQAIAGV